MEMLLPIIRILPQKFGDHGEDRERIEGQIVAPKGQPRRHIYVMDWAPRGFWGGYCFDRELGQGREGGIVCESTRLGYLDVDLDVLVEIGLQSTYCSAAVSTQFRTLREREAMVPELAKRMAIKGLALGDVHPETSLATDGTGSLDDESQHICRVGRRRKVDVLSGDIGGAVILQWQQVDLA